MAGERADMVGLKLALALLDTALAWRTRGEPADAASAFTRAKIYTRRALSGQMLDRTEMRRLAGFVNAEWERANA